VKTFNEAAGGDDRAKRQLLESRYPGPSKRIAGLPREKLAQFRRVTLRRVDCQLSAMRRPPTSRLDGFRANRNRSCPGLPQ
jgi:hypothetical protein